MATRVEKTQHSRSARGSDLAAKSLESPAREHAVAGPRVLACDLRFARAESVQMFPAGHVAGCTLFA
jgi:hypothetical protein